MSAGVIGRAVCNEASWRPANRVFPTTCAGKVRSVRVRARETPPRPPAGRCPLLAWSQRTCQGTRHPASSSGEHRAPRGVRGQRQPVWPFLAGPAALGLRGQCYHCWHTHIHTSRLLHEGLALRVATSGAARAHAHASTVGWCPICNARSKTVRASEPRSTSCQGEQPPRPSDRGGGVGGCTYSLEDILGCWFGLDLVEFRRRWLTARAALLFTVHGCLQRWRVVQHVHAHEGATALPRNPGCRNPERWAGPLAARGRALRKRLLPGSGRGRGVCACGPGL